MKRLVIFLLSCMVLFNFSISSSQAEESKNYLKESKERVLNIPKCDKPIGRVLVKSFECKAASCFEGKIKVEERPTYIKSVGFSAGPIGDGLADMLMTALKNTGCFEIIDKTVLEDLKEELALMGKSLEEVRKPADYIITGAITVAEKSGSLGGGGLVIPLSLRHGIGLKIGKTKMHLGLDIRVVRVKNASIAIAKSIEGRSENWNFGLAMGGLAGNTPWLTGVSKEDRVPLEEAARDLIANAVTLIVNELVKEAPDVKVQMIEVKPEKKKDQNQEE
ncbi:MAG: CsgG/HfaB family protein [Brevinematia bacterium]